MHIKFSPPRLTRTKATFLSGFVALLAVAGIAVPTYAVGCDNNAIMYCGYSSPSDFIRKVKGNASGNGHNDLQAIYRSFGFDSADYDRFIKNAKPAKVDRTGKIYVDGKVVGTNAVSFGRSLASHDGAGMQTRKIGSSTIYGNSTSKTFISQSSFTGHVLFDATGTPELVLLDECGNPVTGTFVKSSAKCELLKATQVAGKPSTYSFTTNTSKSGLATISKYVYDFGDGTTKTVTSGSAVTHTYAKPGNYTAKVTVYATAPGGTTITSTSASCTKVITIPFYSCVDLKGPDPKYLTYTFVATAKATGGAKLVSGSFDFGDGQKQADVKASGDTVTTSHTYDKEGTYSVSAVLTFNVNGAMLTADACKATVSPNKPPVPECKPGIPVGDSRCTPCPYNPDLASDDPNCVEAVKELPNTGAGNVIAITSAALIGGFLLYRHLLFKQHKAAFLAADNDTAPLPLANPLETEEPLAGTPLEAEVKKGFRRRPF
jgi:hypothetical protein